MEIKVTLQNLLQELNGQGILSDEKFESIKSAELKTTSTAWYIKLLMVFGAWVASLFFLLAMFITVLKSNEGVFICGLLWIISATALSRFTRQFFFIQMALAVSVAGHIMIFVSLIDTFKTPSASAIGAIILSIVLYPFYQDSLHRFLSPLSAFMAVIFLIYDEKCYPLYHLLIVVEVLGAAILFTQPRIKSAFRPLAYACALAIPGTLLLILARPEYFLLRYWASLYTFDWLLSKLIFSIALLWLYQWIAGGVTKLNREFIKVGVVGTLLLGAISTPGILAAFWLMILGYALRDKILIGLAIAFFPLFISLFYYNLDMTLDIKAYILLVSGVVLLIARWYLTSFQKEEKEILAIESNVVKPNFRSYALWSTVAVSILVFFVVNAMIVQKNNVIASGKTVLLRLAPRDPRSLIQGDYMSLNYDLYRQFNDDQLKQLPRDGVLVVKLDEKGVATFSRFYQGGDLAKDEQLLHYKVKGDKYFQRMQLGAESFFFQEKQANLYQLARYGELKVDSKGASVLIGLRGENFEKLGPKK